MCKNLIIAGVKPNKQDELKKFMIEMAPLITKNDRDGFGYAAFTDNGMYGEHWLNPEDAFKYRQIWSKKDEAIKKEFQGALIGDPRYNCFVEKPNVDYDKENIFAMVLHARMATTPKGLKNVHPFVHKGHALIHNGMIQNYEEKHLKLLSSTCDSEVILNSYIDREVAKDIKNIEAVAQDLRGSYTCGVLTKDSDNTPILDIFRNTNPLGGCYIRELDALVFCTDVWKIQEACRNLKWKSGSFLHLDDNNLIRINAKTGSLMSKTTFKSIWANSSFDVWTRKQWDEWYKRNNIETEDEPVVEEVSEAAFNNVEGLTEEEKKMHPKQIEIMRRNGSSTPLEDSIDKMLEDQKHLLNEEETTMLLENRNGKIVH